MDPTTLALQQARVAAIQAITQQAICQFIALDDEGAKRAKTKFQQRVHWDVFVENNKDRPMFRRHLRMSYDSFCTLLDQIRCQLNTIDEEMAALRGGPILHELYLYATIRYLAGASYSDICFFCGISKSTFYSILWRTIHAINRAISIDFPASPEDCAATAADFEKISYDGVVSNCVGALDGYLLPIVTPWKQHAKNVRSYFSGHYQKYGVNIQACCDAHCRFTFVGVGGPGVTKDRTAIKDSGLYDLVENLPAGYICIGDCAYQPTENLVPIFGGDLALKKDNDNFNFFASQLRIRIEMAFGLMTRKWGILQRPLSNGLPSIKHIICCIARLHNFCIDERLKDEGLKGGIPSVTAASNVATSLSFTQLAYMNAAAQVRTQQGGNYKSYCT
jgi:DDE superfamily endonuclease